MASQGALVSAFATDIMHNSLYFVTNINAQRLHGMFGMAFRDGLKPRSSRIPNGTASPYIHDTHVDGAIKISA
jgi:hypothetical protein